MDSFVIDMAGRAVGLSAEEIAKFEKDAPGIAALIHGAREAAPIFQQLQALYEQEKPLIAQGEAIYEKLKPFIAQAIAELPTLDADAQIIVRVLAGHTPAPGTGPGSRPGGGIG